LHVAEDYKADSSPHITLSATFGLSLHVAEDYEADSSPHMVQGRSVVWIAANKGHTSILELLMSHGADINTADQEVLQP